MSHRRGRRTIGPCSGGGGLALGGGSGRGGGGGGGGRRRGCWSLMRGRRRGFGRLPGARNGLEAGVVVGRGHGDGVSSNGRSARGMLGAMRGQCAVCQAVNAWIALRSGSQRRLGGVAQYAARSRWTTPQRRVVAVDAGEL